jgi:serine phosphatase RsbU (regulator of sigma subunit)/tetratricopeptide (TPR) repeat protein
VLVIEDLHWSDPSSVDVLTKLLSLVGSIPVLFCLVSRIEREDPGWQLVSIARELFGNSLTEIYLEPLSERDSRKLVANLLEIEALPEAFRSMILSKAEGNPFFVEEVVRMLLERGIIVNRGAGWIVDEDIEDLQIPENLQGLLMARIDRLSEEDKHTLRVASVVGRQFPVKVLRNVLVRQARIDEFNRLEPKDALTNLESTGLIRVAQYEPDLEYLFRHSLVQDAAYDSILLADRRKLHLMVGETVERLYPELVSSRELAPRLGQHFSEAGDAERAIKYYSLAGQAALDSYANQEAEDFFQKGLSMASAIPEQIRLLSGLGEAINNQSRYLEAIEIWREAIRLAGSIMDLPQMARLYSWAARAAWWAENTPLSLELCLEGIQSTAGSPPSPEKASLIHETARAYYFNGVPTQAETYCLQSLEMAEQLGDVAVQADSLTTLAILPNQDPEKTENALNKAINLAESAGRLKIASRAHINAGSMRRGFFGDMEGALFHYRRSLEIAQRRGVVKEQLFSLGAILSIYLDLGELNKLQEMQPQFEELIQSLTDQHLARQELNRFQVIIQIMRGEWIEAYDSIFFLAEEVRKTGNLRGLIDICLVCISGAIEAHWMGETIDWLQMEWKIDEVLELCERGMGNKAGPLANFSIIRVIQGRLEEARQILQQAEQATGERDDIWIFSLLWYAKGILAAAEKVWETAFSNFEEAYHFVIRSNQRWNGGKILLRWADALVQRGEPADLDRALGLLREAVALFESMQAPIYLGFIEQQRKKIRKRMLVQATDQIGIAREMTQAGQIQRGFLPDQLPDLPGWSLAAVLVPARETSGDYYDFIPLPDGRLGIVIADVTDKGAGAALFMASSRTLIRTYSEEFPGEPARVLEHANHRLLLDTHAGLFVTMFYAVLDPAEGTILYCNAGHNPPFVFNDGAVGKPASLSKTGVPLGILDGEVWETDILEMQPGDWLVLYTDGVTEAQNVGGEYYEERRIQAFFEEALKKGNADQLNAVQLLAAQLEDLQAFIGSAPRSDDLTMLVIGRI